MIKFKAKIKSQQLVVRAKLSFGDEVNKREIELLSEKPIRGLLKPTLLRMRLMQYTGPQGVALDQYVKDRKLTGYEFYYIMAQIIEMSRKVEANRLFLRHVILDLRYVFINPNTKELQFIYLPLLSNALCVDIQAFMEEIIYSASFDENENQNYIPQYIGFLRSMEPFSVDKLERYIAKQNKQIAKQMKRQTSGESGFMTNKRADYYKHYEAKGEREVEEDYDDTTMLMEEDDDYDDTTMLMEEEDDYDDTTMLMEEDDDYDDTTMLIEEEDYDGTTILVEEEIQFPYLIRKSNGEKVSVDKPVFRIGKEESYVDYFIPNNPAVSRSHADIITRGERYFVYDHNSTNKTYINDMKLPVRSEIEIFDGSALKLANEEFEFHISE